ncbi:hypothetical protein ARZXY2_4908 (plasmid) [Arthrobacter sp. ZXY-2]|nr:hypothetical protein ARZXY2_4908 [Arthrobacter sp. ZXY-2]
MRTSRISAVTLDRVPELARAIDCCFPEVQAPYKKARLQELLKLATSTIDDPAKTGIQLAFGLDTRTDLFNSKQRREQFANFFNVSAETVRRRHGLEDQVITKLAHAISKLMQFAPTARNPASSATGGVVVEGARFLHLQEDLFSGRLQHNQFRTSHSPAAYRDLIASLEKGARQIDSFPKRLSVVFKSDKAIQRIAEQRFGRGSSMIEPYVEEHMLRRRTFYENLSSGTTVREIYTPEDLRSYLLNGRHGKGVDLAQDDLRESIELWRTCAESFPGNYLVAFTSERIPFKYEVIDKRAVVMHEAISGNDRDRLNAFAIEQDDIARVFSRDFELVWERTPPADRTLGRTLDFINELHRP